MTDEQVFLEFLTRMNVDVSMSATPGDRWGERIYTLDNFSSENFAGFVGHYLQAIFKDDGSLYIAGVWS